MNIRVLGAHNSESQNTRYMTLLVDGVLALDAGGLTSSLSFEEQMKLKAVLLTHHHYDHLRDIPALAMNLFLRSSHIDIYSHQPVFNNLDLHFLNGSLYSEFQKKPEGNPVLRFQIMEPFKEVWIEGYRIKAVPMNHSQPALGYQINSPDDKCIFYTGDTGSGLSDVWRHIQPQILFIEVSALPLSAVRIHAVDLPVKVTCSRRKRAWLLITAPVRRWHSRQWHMEMRAGSPSIVR
jgi:ribonuclease BN (tRNA processing enzyme)